MCELGEKCWHKPQSFWLIIVKCQNKTQPSVFQCISLPFILPLCPCFPLGLSHLPPFIRSLLYYCYTLGIIEPIYSHSEDGRGSPTGLKQSCEGLWSSVSVVSRFNWCNLCTGHRSEALWWHRLCLNGGKMGSSRWLMSPQRLKV